MMQASAYGRLAADPRPIQTQTGKPMTVARIAVDIGENHDDAPLWLVVVCFSRVAEDLARHAKGDLISVSGRMVRKNWVDRQSGEKREALQIVADTVISARTVRPSGGKKRGAS